MFNWLLGGEEEAQAKKPDSATPAPAAAADETAAAASTPADAAPNTGDAAAAAPTPAEEEVNTATPDAAEEAAAAAAAASVEEAPPTPPVVVPDIWEHVDRPAPGDWVAREVQLLIREKPKAAASTWKFADPEDGGPPSLHVTAVGSEEICTVYPASGCDEVAYPLPELVDPIYCAIGATYVHWLMPLSASQYLVLSQLVEDANGGSSGIRRTLTNEGAKEEEPDWDVQSASPFDLASPVWSTCAVRRGFSPPWWFKHVTELASAKRQGLNKHLPPSLKAARLSHSSMAWQVKEGWDRIFSSSAVECFVMLQDCALFFAPRPHSAEVEEFPLRGVEVIAGDIAISTSSTIQYPMTLRNRNGKSLILNFHTQTERDLWTALVEVSALQLQPSRKLSEQKGHLYEALLLMRASPLCTPSVNPNGPAPETADPDTIQTGYVIVQAEEGTWVHQGWLRRFVTLHKTYLTYRTHKDSLEDLKVLPLRHVSVAKIPQEKNPWVIGLFTPFAQPVQLWCDSKEVFAKWLASCDRAVRVANHGVVSQHHIPVDRVPAQAAAGLMQTVTSSKGVVITPHGIQVPEAGPMHLPYVQGSAWRILDTPDGLLGSEDGEAEYVEGEGGARELRWKPSADEGVPVPSVAPRHVNVRGRPVAEVVPGVAAECVLPEKVLGQSVLGELSGSLKVTRASLMSIPEAFEYTLRYSEFHQWLAVLSGSVRVVVFSGACYTLITKDYPKMTASSCNDRIKDDWGAEGNALATLGGRQVVVNAGDALYIPVDHFYSVKALSSSLVMRSLSSPVRNQ